MILISSFFSYCSLQSQSPLLQQAKQEQSPFLLHLGSCLVPLRWLRQKSCRQDYQVGVCEIKDLLVCPTNKVQVQSFFFWYCSGFSIATSTSSLCKHIVYLLLVFSWSAFCPSLLTSQHSRLIGTSWTGSAATSLVAILILNAIGSMRHIVC